MAIEIQDVLKADIVLVGVNLLNTRESLNSFIDSVDKEVAVEPFSAAPNYPASSIRIVFDRDRISIVLTEGASIIAQEYPNREGLAQLTEIAGQAIDHTRDVDEMLGAIGFNIDLMYDQDSGVEASAYIADRLLTEDAFGSGGWRLAAGANRSIIQTDGQRITQIVAPRFNDPSTTKIFMSLNLHTETTKMPDLSEVLASLQHAWALIHKFPVEFDQGNVDV